MAAVRLAVREARVRVPAGRPLHLVGYSNGGALALKYALDSVADQRLAHGSPPPGPLPRARAGTAAGRLVGSSDAGKHASAPGPDLVHCLHSRRYPSRRGRARRRHSKENTMGRTVHCVKLGQEAEGLDFPPYPGALGQRIFEQVSREAWQAWLEHQKRLVNENRLNLADVRARRYLAEQMERHFFGGGADEAQGYVPPSSR